MQARIRTFAVLLAAAVAIPAFAADNPWFGTWKLDPAKSHMTGETFTYSKTANGMDHFTNGVLSFDFTANGLDYPVMGGATTSWVSTGPNEWKTTDKMNGKETNSSVVKLSTDCKTMTETTTGTRPDGTDIHNVTVFTKAKSGEGCLEGTWKSTKVSQSAPGSFVISQGGSPDTLKWEIPGWKETVEGKADGTDLPLTGPQVPANMTVAFKADGARKLSFEVKQAGKSIEKGEQVLAPNGKSFTETSWTPGKENEKQTYVFNKQG